VQIKHFLLCLNNCDTLTTNNYNLIKKLQTLLILIKAINVNDYQTDSRHRDHWHNICFISPKLAVRFLSN